MVFPVAMYGGESRTIKKTKHQRIDAFQLWCWRRPLKVSWTARRSNQSILKEISPEYSLEGLINSNTLATWCKELTHWKRPWCWERQKAGGGGDDRGPDGWMTSLTWWTWVWVSSGNWWSDREAWRAAVHGVAKSRAQLSDWTEQNYLFRSISYSNENKKKNKHIGPNKLKSFCIAKKTKKQDEKTTLRIGKSICNWSDQQEISLQNIHTVSGLLAKKKQTTLSKIWQKNYTDIYFSNMKFRWWRNIWKDALHH